MPFPGSISLFVKVMKILPRPKGIRIINIKTTTAYIKCDCVSGIGLQLNRMGSRICSSLNNFKSPGKTLIVITTHFGNHKWWLVWADEAAGDVNAHRTVENAGSGGIRKKLG